VTTAAPAPLRVVQVGAGAMGRNWLRTLQASPDVELVGVADLDEGLARTALDALGIRATVAGSLGDLLEGVDAEAVIDVTVPVAHTAVNVEALFAGLPVLCEKPAAPTVADALVQSAAAAATGRLLMISQSRRYYASLARYREAIGGIGGAGVLSTEFFRAPHFGGFREEMAHPLLIDMAVHSFDAARYLLDADPVSVFCEAWNPSWSWFAGDAAASAVFRFDDGTRYQYTGSWVAAGLETSWNGVWRASGAQGTATWDGEHRVRSSVSGDEDVPPGTAEEIAGALAEFVASVRSGAEPSGAIGRNILSLAMVEAAVESAQTGRRVEIAELLTRARAAAVERAPRAEIRAALEAEGVTASSV
jgi:predicted dehydrogenase